MSLQNRRNFLKTAGIVGGTFATISSNAFPLIQRSSLKKIKIEVTDSNFEREPLIRPFGFKGGYMSEIWQTAVWM